MKIRVAKARKILVAVWHMLPQKEDFMDFYLEKLESNKLITYLHVRSNMDRLLMHLCIL